MNGDNGEDDKRNKYEVGHAVEVECFKMVLSMGITTQLDIWTYRQTDKRREHKDERVKFVIFLLDLTNPLCRAREECFRQMLLGKWKIE